MVYAYKMEAEDLDSKGSVTNVMSKAVMAASESNTELKAL